MGQAAGSKSSSSKALDRTRVVSLQPTLARRRQERRHQRVEVSKMNRNGARRRMGRPVTRTWSTDFLLREGSSREEIGKWLKNKSIPWQRRRRLLQVVTGTFPCGQQLVKYGYKEKAECILCKKAYEENGGSWKGVLPKETIGHIQSAGCLGQKEVVTAAHNASESCYRRLMCMGKRIGT